MSNPASSGAVAPPPGGSVTLGEFTLAPKGLAVAADGSVAAPTVQGLVVAQAARGPKAPVPRMHAIPTSRDAAAALVGASPDEPGQFAWVTVDRVGRVLLHHSAAPGQDVVATVDGAESVFACGPYLLVLAAGSVLHVFLMPPAVVEAHTAGDVVPEFTPLGTVRTPGNDPDAYIGLAHSNGADDGRAAVALFAQDDAAGTLLIGVAALNGASPVADTWSSSLPLADLPHAWAVAADGSAVCVVPPPGTAAPMCVGRSGRLRIPALEQQLVPVNGAVVAVSSVLAQGFLFAVRPAADPVTQLELRCVVTAKSATAPVIARIEGLKMKKATTVLLGAHRRSSAVGGVYVRVVVGRTIYDVSMNRLLRPAPMATAAAAPSAKAAPAAQEEAAEASSTAAAASTKVASSSLALLAALARAPAPMHNKTTDAVVNYVCGKLERMPADAAVVRDPGVEQRAGSEEGPRHAVCDAIISAAARGSSSSSGGADATEGLRRYFSVLRDVSAATLIYVLRAEAAAARPIETAARNVAVLIEAASEKLRGSLHAAWADCIGSSQQQAAAAPDGEQQRRRQQQREALAAPLVVVVHPTLVHALGSGRLAVFRCAAAVIDAVMVADADAVVASPSAGAAVADAQRLLAAVGRWASTEPGTRLGQLTAHSGPECHLRKEAHAAPLQGYRIHTQAPIRVDHEFHTV